MKKTTKKIVGIALILCMTQVLFGGLSMVVSAVNTLPEANATYNISSYTTGIMPSNWTGSTAKFMPWGGYIQYGYDSTAAGQMILDQYIWTNTSNFTYSLPRVDTKGGTFLAYFCYTDANNYYAMSIDNTNVRFIKCVAGESTVLATGSNTAFNSAPKLDIVRTPTGATTMSVANVVIINGVVDTTFTSGKIGIGYANNGWGFVNSFAVSGSALEVVTHTPEPGSVNVALKKHVTVSSTYLGYVGSNAVDGIISDTSRWLATNLNPNEWIIVDFGAPMRISAAEVYTGYGAIDALPSFSLQSYNGSNWVNIPGAVFTGESTIAKKFTFEPIVVDKVRLYVGVQSYVRLKELVVLGIPVTTDYGIADGGTYSLESNQVTAKATIVKGDGDAVAFAAAYDESGKLIGIDASGLPIDSSTVLTDGAVSFQKTFAADGTVSAVKVFVWESLNGCIPVCKAATCTASN